MSEKTKPGPFPDHRGKATVGSRLVPLEQFAQEVAGHGRRLDPSAREAARRVLLERPADPVDVEGPYRRVAIFGGVYNNHLALEALLEAAARDGAEAIYCLGDLGGFGPSPEKVRPLLDRGDVSCIQGNYEESLSTGHEDCNCGYTDPRDNHFAELSYRYTERHCSPGFRRWMGELPRRRRLRVGDRVLELAHGSPRRINEFMFESTSPDAWLAVLLDQLAVDGLLCTHTGLDWHRRLADGRDVINVGALGRPANDGDPRVRYAWLEAREGGLNVELRRLAYDHRSLADEMRRESLPEEFVETIVTGWWTTCLEILPARERARSRY